MSFRRNLNAAKSFSKDNEATFRNVVKFADVIDSFIVDRPMRHGPRAVKLGPAVRPSSG